MHRYNRSQRKLQLKSDSKRTSIKDLGCLFLKRVEGEEKEVREYPSERDHEQEPLFYKGDSA